MKYSIYCLFLLLFLNFYSQGQEIDTIKYYNCYSRAFKSYTNGDSIIRFDHKVNGRKVSHILGEQIVRCNCILERSCGDTSKRIFYVKTYNLNDELLYSGYQTEAGSIFWGPYKEYYKNGNIKIDGRYLFFDDDWSKYKSPRNYNVKTGDWRHYSKSGKIKKTESYFQGQKIK